jgi:hypothetical protein
MRLLIQLGFKTDDINQAEDKLGSTADLHCYRLQSGAEIS